MSSFHRAILHRFDPAILAEIQRVLTWIETENEREIILSLVDVFRGA